MRSPEEIQHSLSDTLRETYSRYPDLKPYDEVFRFVYDAFYRKGGLIIFDESKKGSLISPEWLYSKKVFYLYIGVRDRTVALTLIWSVLHEYGHTLQPSITDEIHDDPQLTYNRERDAWDRAQQKLHDFEVLRPHEAAFIAYRDECLLAYQAKLP